MPAKFQIQQAKDGSFYFNLLAANGETILTSQMYASKATAKKGITSVQNNAGDSERFEVQKNKSGKHYFVLKAANGLVIGTGEAYSGTTAVNKGIKSVSTNAPKARIEDES
ncbi:MAG: YegP family protein [Planctomycetota bacterium]